MTTSPATAWSVAFLGQLIADGVSHCVVSPGARSQALALAALEWERAEGNPLTVHVVVDERSAAFRALGLALESHTPVVCIATSGSAPSHYYPALLEARHVGAPVIVVSADRPEELRGVGANQTTTQSELFGSLVPTITAETPTDIESETPRAVAREAVSLALSGGPAHVTVGFREPLSSAPEPGSLVLPAASVIHPRGADTNLEIDPQPGTLVIAGHGAGSSAEELALSLGAPLIAEVVSGARFGPHLVPAYRDVLANRDLVSQIRRVITLGRPTLSRQVWALLSDSSYQHIVVRGSALESPNPTRSAQVVDSLTPTRQATKEETLQWVKPWVMAGREIQDAALAGVTPQAPDIDALTSEDQATRSGFARQEMQVLREPVTRASLSLAVWEATWPHDRLVFGASRMVREADEIVPGKNIPVYSNRGLSGIDGTISTARGIAVASAAAGNVGTTRVLLGDLAFLHDVGSLMREPGVEDLSRVHLIIANDGGGSIFDQLEVSHSASVADRDRVLFTPHDVDLAALASAYGWAYRTVAHRGDLAEALSASDQFLVIDVPLPRE
jgi:2-succinyl-5-enolpyruvyl-6-hydroxy-3-cyclohexene-1-carboxylate synthase